ncbi:SERTA domain-containing protein 3 [Marasmius crinis-equi]|uniref:SERTA domain-containing protein 3 n=1 Tax=Marasmius crinis-equi TaxID=585013 RepID=A0ABR3FCX7_9AGAR
MVNPGAFKGSRKLFLESALPGYFTSVLQGVGPEFLQTTIQRYLNRFPIDLDEDTEPSEDELDAVNDEEALPDVYPPVKDPEETDEAFRTRVAAFEQQKKDTKSKIDQIVRWFKYRLQKHNEGTMKGEPHPLDILLANLAGIMLTKPGRMRTAYNVWGKENQELIGELLVERLETKDENGSEEEASASGMMDGRASKKKKKGKAKKNGRKYIKNGDEGYLAVRQEITMSEFAKLSEEVQQEWKMKAEEEHKEQMEKWKACQCIDRLVKFMQPILDGVFRATGWPCSFIAGGPEPADAGRLNILSIHSSTTSGAVPMTFGAACRPAFKKYWIPVFTGFLQMCFSMDESKARGLDNTDMPTLREQLAEQEEETTANVDAVELLSGEEFMQEVRGMMETETGVATEREKGKAKDKRELPKAESARSRKIADLHEKGSQSRKAASPVGTTSAAPMKSRNANATRPRPQAEGGGGKAKTTATTSHVPLAEAAKTTVTTSYHALAENTATTSHVPPAEPALTPPVATPKVAQTSVSNGQAILPLQSHTSTPTTTPTTTSQPPSMTIIPRSNLSPPPTASPPHNMTISESLAVSPSTKLSPPSPPHRFTVRSQSRVSLPTPSEARTESHSPPTQSTAGAAKRPNTRSQPAQPGTDSQPLTLPKRKAAGAERGNKRRKIEATSGHQGIWEESPGYAETEEEDELAEDIAVVVPDDAPAYIWKVVQMCEQLDLGNEMMKLVEAWVEMERREGFEGTAVLTANSRPAQVGEWIQHGRRPNFKAKISDVEVYGDKFATWFKKCSPPWRMRTAGTIVMSRGPGKDWSEMKVTGQNGLASVIAAMAFWKYALDLLPGKTPREKQARERLEGQFKEAFDEVSYSISQMTRG